MTLVLSRYKGEIIRIGKDIKVKVVAIRNGQVQLGIIAPSNIRVYREEEVEKK